MKNLAAGCLTQQAVLLCQLRGFVLVLTSPLTQLPFTLLQLSQSPDFHPLRHVLTEHTADAQLYCDGGWFGGRGRSMARVRGPSLGSWRRLEIANTEKRADDTSQSRARLWKVWSGSFKRSGAEGLCLLSCVLPLAL